MVRDLCHGTERGFTLVLPIAFYCIAHGGTLILQCSSTQSCRPAGKGRQQQSSGAAVTGSDGTGYGEKYCSRVWNSMGRVRNLTDFTLQEGSGAGPSWLNVNTFLSQKKHDGRLPFTLQ